MHLALPLSGRGVGKADERGLFTRTNIDNPEARA